MKIRSVGRMILTLMTAALLTGCQLARPNAAASSDGDALIGVFITREHLELGDLEEYFNDDPEALTSQSPNYPSQMGQSRIYAELIESGKTREMETGDTHILKEYVFKEPAGIPFFIAQMKYDSGEAYIATHATEAVQNARAVISSSDTEQRMVLDGTIYFKQTSREKLFFINSVYQSPDGRVYLTAGSGMSTSPGQEGESGGMSVQKDSTVTKTQNGQTMTLIHQIKISFEEKKLPQKVQLLQMDEQNRLINEIEIDPLKLPEDLSVDPGAAYLILEEYTPDQTGKPEIVRSIINSGGGSFQVNQLGEFDTVVPNPVLLNGY